MATALRGPIRIADLAPEIIDAICVMRDGEPVTLRGYVNGRRCPSRVLAAYAAAVRDHAQQDGTVFSFGAYLNQTRECLLAVVIGLEETEADVLAGDQDDEAGAPAVLRLLKWWTEPDAVDEDDDDTGEAMAESPTSASSSRGSRRSTARTTG